MKPKYDSGYRSSSYEKNEVPVHSIDISGYWDTESRNENFLSQLKQLPFYNKDHLYCGFDARVPITQGEIFCGDEEDFGIVGHGVNPLDFALSHLDVKKAKIAVYDRTKMSKTDIFYKFEINTKEALIAVIDVVDKT